MHSLAAASPVSGFERELADLSGMLPDDFRWQNRCQYDTQRTALSCVGKQVALLLPTVSGGWFARLKAHQPITEPLVTRRCTTLESGWAGIELWAVRHADRLRAELEGGDTARELEGSAE